MRICTKPRTRGFFYEYSTIGVILEGFVALSVPEGIIVFIAYVQLLLSSYLFVAVVVDIILAILTYTLARQLYVSMGGREDVVPTTRESWTWLWVILCAVCFILTFMLLIAIVIVLTVPSVQLL